MLLKIWEKRTFKGWKLEIAEGFMLERGHSGSPVIDKETEQVFAIVSHREPNGKIGRAISVAGLKMLEDIALQIPVNQKIYISYTQIDEKWSLDFIRHLKTYLKQKSVKNIDISLQKNSNYLKSNEILLIIVSSKMIIIQKNISEQKKKLKNLSRKVVKKISL